MKDNSELIGHLGVEWGKFWISSGIEVYHRNSINREFNPKEDAVIMIVDQVLKKRAPVKGLKPEEPRPFFINGVTCHWFANGSNTFQEGRFHTKELYPASVVDKGLLEDWLKR